MFSLPLCAPPRKGSIPHFTAYVCHDLCYPTESNIGLKTLYRPLHYTNGKERKISLRIPAVIPVVWLPALAIFIVSARRLLGQRRDQELLRVSGTP